MIQHLMEARRIAVSWKAKVEVSNLKSDVKLSGKCILRRAREQFPVSSCTLDMKAS